MKRTIAIILTVILAAVMLVGCSNEQSKLLGTWKAEANLAEGIEQVMLEELGEQAEYFSIQDFTVNFVMTLNSDGTYSMTVEEDSVQTAFDALMEDMEAGMVKMLEEQISEMGIALSVEDMLAASGMTMESMMDQLKQGLENAGVMEQVIEESTEEGRFKAKDGKLYMSAGLEYQVDENVYDTYTLDGDTLTLVTHVGGEEEEQDLVKYVYPLVFNKIG